MSKKSKGTAPSSQGKMMSAAAMAKELKMPAAAMKKKIVEAGIKPDSVRCGCSYYSKETLAKIRKTMAS